MFQIIAIAIISAIIAIFLRSIDTSLSFLTIIASGIIIIILSLDYLTDTFSLIDTLEFVNNYSKVKYYLTEMLFVKLKSLRDLCQEVDAEFEADSEGT